MTDYKRHSRFYELATELLHVRDETKAKIAAAEEMLKTTALGVPATYEIDATHIISYDRTNNRRWRICMNGHPYEETSTMNRLLIAQNLEGLLDAIEASAEAMISAHKKGEK